MSSRSSTFIIGRYGSGWSGAATPRGFRGGSAFRAIAGFGRHHTMHEAHFIELAGLQPIEVEFIVTDKEGEDLLDLIRREKVRLFYAQIPAHFDVINPDASDALE